MSENILKDSFCDLISSHVRANGYIESDILDALCFVSVAAISYKKNDIESIHEAMEKFIINLESMVDGLLCQKKN